MFYSYVIKDLYMQIGARRLSVNRH